MSRYIDFSVFGNAQTIEADLDSVIVVELDVCRDCFFELLGVLPGSAVVHFVFHSAEEPLTCCIVGATAFLRHRAKYSELLGHASPAAASIMCSAV